MMSLRSMIFISLAGLTLAACGGVREDLGLGRSPPDEFAVMDRPPLAMPPDFALRPPKPGAPRPQEVNLTQRANDALFSSSNLSGLSHDNEGAEPSEFEKTLLEATGASKVDPSIRETVDREAAEKVVGTVHLVDKLLFWKKEEKPAATVDAPAEADRIKQALANGEPLNQGATPIIERQKSGWLGL